MSTILERPLSEAAQLLLQRADELQQQRVPVQVVPPSPEVPTISRGEAIGNYLESLRDKRRRAAEARQRERVIASLRRPPKRELVNAIVTKPCCSQCGAEGPVSRKFKLCDECRQKREAQRQKKHRVYRLVSTPRDYRQELQVYFETNLQQERCPVCGCGIDPELPACGRHLTIVLLKAMRPNPVEV